MNRQSLRTIVILLALSFSNVSAQKLTGSFKIVWDDCVVTNTTLAQGLSGKVYVNPSQGVLMQCIRKGDQVICDYIDEKTGKFKNQPSVFTVELETDVYLFLGNESNSTRLHLNTKNSTVLLKSNIFFLDNPDYFGVKMCSGRIVR